MRAARIALVVTALAGAAPAAAQPPARVDVAPDEVDAIAARLAGHRVVIAPDRRAIEIVDVAGDGAPRVGVIERDGAHLVLVAADGRWRLAGPLARPRIAGPGYTVWVIADIAADADRGGDATLRVRRIGVLRPPRPAP